MPMPTIASKARWSSVFDGRLLVVGDLVEAGDDGVGAEADQQRVEAGDPDPVLDPVVGADPADLLGLVRAGLLDALEGGELRRLVVGHPARGDVADVELDRRGDRSRP